MLRFDRSGGGGFVAPRLTVKPLPRTIFVGCVKYMFILCIVAIPSAPQLTHTALEDPAGGLRPGRGASAALMASLSSCTPVLVR